MAPRKWATQTGLKEKDPCEVVLIRREVSERLPIWGNDRTQTAPGFKGDTATAAKPDTLEKGVFVQRAALHRRRHDDQGEHRLGTDISARGAVRAGYPLTHLA